MFETDCRRDRTFPRGLLIVSILAAGIVEVRPARAQDAASSPAGGSKAVAPGPVGAREDVADVVIWSVDSDASIKRWNDPAWIGHARLLRLLGDAGMRPRVEHMAHEDFPGRWDDADGQGHAPELIVADRFIGKVRDLELRGRLISVRSERLTWRAEAASCGDMRGRRLFLVAGSPHEADGRRAVGEVLKPGSEPSLPGPDLPTTAGRAEAVVVAKRAVVAYVSGDPERVWAVASASSPQLSRCTRPPAFRRGWDVEAGSVEIRGNEAVAFAKVEMRVPGATMIGADPVAVVLRREGPHWKAFSVGDDVFNLRALPDLCRLGLRPRAGPQDPSAPWLLHPGDSEPIGQDGRSFAWEVPAGGEPLAAQVCEVLLDEKGSSWPSSRIKVYAGEPRGRSLTLAATMRDVTGVRSDEMRWCIWAIAADGRISASEVRHYLRAQLKP